MSRPAGMSRRRFLTASGGAAALGAVLAACGGSGLAIAPEPAPPPDLSARERVVRFANWPDYVDTGPGGSHPTLAEFTRQTGIAVEYSEPIKSNEQFVGEIGVQLALARDPGYDLIVVTDWMAAEMFRLGWAQRLDRARTANSARLVPELRSQPAPGMRRCSLPWQGGFTGLAWNVSATGRAVTSITDLLTAPDLHGRVGLVDDMRDVIGLILLDLRHDPSRFSRAQFAQALSVLQGAADAGQIRSVTNDYVPALRKGTLAACVAWAGDLLDVAPTTPDLAFALPTAGGMIWSDNMVIPAYCRHKRNAERLMDYYYEPAPAARLAAYERFICPVLGAQAAMGAVAPALAEEPYIFPGPGLLSRVRHFQELSSAANASYTGQFTAVLGL